MTFKEAKKILEKEGYFLTKVSSNFKFPELPVWEKQEVVEAKNVANDKGFALGMKENVWLDRQKRLKKEYEKNTKAPGPGEEQSKEKKGIIYLTTFPKADFYYKHVLNEGNPALNESASQFNDALLDEQAKKIAELTKENERLERVCKTTTDEFNELYYRMITKSDKFEALGKEIAKLNGIIHKKNMKIDELRKESSRHLRGKIKMFGENVDLEQMLKDKDAVLADVAEELRLSKIREKNLTEVSQKYMKENEELREKVAEKTKLVEMVRKGSKEYCEYGIAAEKMIRKMAKVIVGKGFIRSEDFEKYRLWANGYRFNPQLPDFSEEEEKKLSLFRDDSVGAVTNQKDCSPIKDTHSAVDIADEGKDLSDLIVLCGKDFIDALKKVKDVWQV